MCGIAGIIGQLDEDNRAALQRMNGAMVHRGPDASGTWVSTRMPAVGVRYWHTAVFPSLTSRPPVPSQWWTRDWARGGF